jgi:putative DNA primase/helicase
MKTLLATIKAFFASLGQAPIGPTTRPSTSCGNINALLLHLCDFDYELHTWVLRWLAYPLRNPGTKMSTCILVNGGQGTGKTLFFRNVIGEIYGDAGRSIGTSHLQAHFLDWTQGAQFVVIDGDYSTRSMAQLKHLVTDSAVYLTARMKPTQLVPNNMNFVFLTGAMDFLPTSASDRRFVVIEAPPAREPRFYQAVRSEIAEGGVEAFYDFLLNRLDMGDFNPTTAAPMARMQEIA